MATQTTYYEFNKPEGTDLVNPLVDTNPNWDALDADLHEFNERSISNCTEIVTLGVHAISRLDQTAKFLKWIATANFTAGDTFTVDGLVVSASTPAGASLATNAYVAGAVVLACLNADNSAMTIFVSGTNVASDSERLGGELPSYYGTASDVSDNASDITNLQNQVGNTSIVGIGDGTCTGAIDTLNDSFTYVRGTSLIADTPRALPATWNEILFVTPLAANENVILTIHVCKEALQNRASCTLRAGYCDTPSAYAALQLKIENNTAYIATVSLNGTEVKSTTTTEVYYR